MAFRRSMIGRRNASYFGASRMSSIARMTTAFTPGSPIHCGVVNFAVCGVGQKGEVSWRYVSRFASSAPRAIAENVRRAATEDFIRREKREERRGLARI